MAPALTFKQGALAGELAVRGLTIEAFAAELEVHRSSIDRANAGLPLSPHMYGLIVTYLSQHPRLEIPDGLIGELA